MTENVLDFPSKETDDTFIEHSENKGSMYISLNLAKKKKFHRYLNPKRICFTSHGG